VEKIRIKRRPLGKKSMEKKSMDIGDVAKMRFENFETLLGFKPRLDLLEGENHEAPDMKKDNGPSNIETPTDDPNRPDANDINRGLGKDYENNPATEVHRAPHEDEPVKQDNNNLKPASLQKKAEELGQGEDLTSESYTSQIPADSGASSSVLPEGAVTAEDEAQGEVFNSEQDAEAVQEEYAEKFMIGAQLADIKIAANLLKDIERYSFIHKVAKENSLQSLQSLLQENRSLYESMNSRVQTASIQKQAAQSDVFIPRTTPSAPVTSGMDPLSAILGG